MRLSDHKKAISPHAPQPSQQKHIYIVKHDTVLLLAMWIRRNTGHLHAAS